MNRKPRILIVDDEPGWCELLSFELDDHGYETVTAQHPADALELLRTQAFDVIVTDVRMPGGMDGLELIEAYRKEKPDQKIIFMTGYALEEKFAKAQDLSLGRCLQKPFDVKELFQMLDDSFQDQGV